MPTIKDQAVCIRHWDWSETSQTVSLFARGHGVLRAVAKGSKRDRSPFSGGLEVLTSGEMVAIVRQNERTPDALATLTSWDLVETFPAIRRNLPAFYTGLYFADLIHHAVRDADPHPVLFDRLVTCLSALEDPFHANTALLCFQWAALVHTGFAPEVHRDTLSGRPLPIESAMVFSPTLGGLAGQAQATETFWRVRGETIDAVRRVAAAENTPNSVEALAMDELNAEVLIRANRLLAWYFRFVLGTWPRSAASAIPGVADIEP